MNENTNVDQASTKCQQGNCMLGLIFLSATTTFAGTFSIAMYFDAIGGNTPTIITGTILGGLFLCGLWYNIFRYLYENKTVLQNQDANACGRLSIFVGSCGIGLAAFVLEGDAFYAMGGNNTTCVTGAIVCSLFQIVLFYSIFDYWRTKPVRDETLHNSTVTSSPAAS
jgi:hypothetical protein